jgi:hypothetical protein
MQPIRPICRYQSNCTRRATLSHRLPDISSSVSFPGVAVNCSDRKNYPIRLTITRLPGMTKASPTR